jgi:hypothetical protein
LHYLSGVYLLRISQKLLFICNLCWLTGIIFRFISLAHWPDLLVKSILVLGELTALPLGLIWYGITAFIFFRGKKNLNIPRWLTIMNLAFIPAIVIVHLC